MIRHIAILSSIAFSSQEIVQNKDSIVVSVDKMSITETLKLDPITNYLEINAKKGVEFSNSGLISSSNPNLKILINTDSDRNSEGSLVCQKSNCISLTGKNSEVQLLKNMEGEAFGIATPDSLTGIVASKVQVFSLINNYSQLLKAIEKVNTIDTVWSFALNRDFNLKDKSNTIQFIGVDGKPFRGNFNGNGYRFFNLELSSNSSKQLAVFPNTRFAKISNLGLENVNIDGEALVAGLVGHASESKISNCYVTGKILGEHSTGGLVAEAYASQIEDSYSRASVSGKKYTGGLLGYSDKGSLIKNTYASSFSSGDEWTGSLAGRIKFSSVENSYWNSDSTSLKNDCKNSDCEIISKSEEALMSKRSYQNWDFETVWLLNEDIDMPLLRVFKPISLTKEINEGQDNQEENTGATIQVPANANYLSVLAVNGQVVQTIRVTPGSEVPKSILAEGTVRFH